MFDFFTLVLIFAKKVFSLPLILVKNNQNSVLKNEWNMFIPDSMIQKFHDYLR